jgi:hypothetical protein
MNVLFSDPDVRTYQWNARNVREIAQILEKITIFHPGRYNTHSRYFLRRAVDPKKWENVLMIEMRPDNKLTGLSLFRIN